MSCLRAAHDRYRKRSACSLRFALGVIVVAVFGCGSGSTSGPSPSTRLVSAGWEYGFCLGPCRGELDVDGTQVRYRVLSREKDEVFQDNEGTLTVEGRTRLDAIVAELPDDLKERYGCPDCADGGRSFIALERSDGTEHVEYERPRPPAVLAELDALLADVIEALGACRPTALVTIGAGCVAASGR